MNSEKAIKIINILNKQYPEAKCSLDFNSTFELLVGVVLSAQCTDERVNKVSKILFAKYSTPIDFKNIDINELEDIIKPCGFYRNKAKNLKAAGSKIVDDFNGVVPNNMDDLTSIPGVGRKSANVIMLEAYHHPVGIAVDTHARRLSNRIGFSSQSDPYKVEMELLDLIPQKYYKDFNHIFMWHGRNICTAIDPKCDVCPIRDLCENKCK